MNPGEVTVLIGTFGDPTWQAKAARAATSAIDIGCVVSLAHEETLAKARTAALVPVDTPWVVHLDADDALTPKYFEGANAADVQPTRIHYRGRGLTHQPDYPRVAGHTHRCGPVCLKEGNYIHIGAIMRTELARLLSWEEWPVYEDYSYWLQAFKMGASFHYAPGIYAATVRSDSRNRGTNKQIRKETHYAIAMHHFPEKDWSYLL